MTRPTWKMRRVLAELLRSREPLTEGEIAALTKYVTVYESLKRLEKMRVIEVTPDGAYQLGPEWRSVMAGWFEAGELP